MNIGKMIHWVTLDNPLDDTVVFSPQGVFASVEPVAPGAFDENKVTQMVGMWYHPQVTFNTRITHKGRSLYVRGIRNVDDINVELELLCEEVVTP